MPWARLDDGWHDHRKVIAAGLEAAGLWVMCLTWASKDRKKSPTPGVVPDEVIDRLAGSRAQKLTRRLFEVGLFDAHTGAGWPIHDFEDYLPKYDSAKAAENGSMGGKAKAEARREASKPLRDRQEKPQRNLARVDARVDPNPVPVPIVVTQVSPLQAPPGKVRTDRLDIERIAKLLGCPDDTTWAARVSLDILGRAPGDVLDETRYVAAAIEAEPDRYHPTPTAPRFALCDHGAPPGACPDCISVAAR